MADRIIRIGIDVGGTFTHAVAVEQPANKVIAHAVTPTTHTAKNSVSEGVVKVFKSIMNQTGATSDEIVFVAHCTTQATNALLEGDVATVGIIGMGKGFEALRAKSDTQVNNLELSQGKILKTMHCYFNTEGKGFTRDAIEKNVSHMKQEGCEVIVASGAFSVDDPKDEELVVDCTQKLGLLATASHEISQLYGLKVRTRTAVINASILPKMTSTAESTNKSIKESGITAPLMIMRSDGGVMDLEQMKRRPILTMLSGPAAGIAAALMYVKISDGIFLEVGGTSTDISAIKNGKAMIKSASVGGHLTYLKTLDSRTVGIGGGSMVRVKDRSICEVGPRSAHIAGLGYIAFSNENELQQVQPKLIQPMPHDPEDYLVAVNENGKRFAITVTDASIVMGMTKFGDYAFSHKETVCRVFHQIGSAFGLSAEQLAINILNKAIEKVQPIVQTLLNEYQLDSSLVSLVGGGGGATSVVPWLSTSLLMKHLIVPKAEVVSAIGVALAMLRDYVEWTVVEPTEKDIIAIRKEAVNRLESMGAEVKSIEVQTEINQTRNILRAIATGSFQMNKNSIDIKKLTGSEILEKTAESFKCEPSEITKVGGTKGLTVFTHFVQKTRFFGLIKNTQTQYRVVDDRGVVKLQSNAGAVYQNVAGNLQALFTFIEKQAEYNDVGMIIPEVFILYGSRIADFSTILNYNQLKELIMVEIKGLKDTEPVIVVTCKRK